MSLPIHVSHLPKLLAGRSKRRQYVSVIVLLALAIGVAWVFFAREHWPVRTVLKGTRRPIYGLTFSPDLRYLAAISDEIEIWDVNSQRVVAKLVHYVCSQVAFSRECDVVATESFGHVKLWELSTGEVHYRYWGKSLADSVSFSPAGDLWATGSWGHPVEVRSMETGERLASFQANVTSGGFTFSPSGRHLAALSHDSEADGSETTTLKVWDTATGEGFAREVRGDVVIGVLGPIMYSDDGSIIAIVDVSRGDNRCDEVLLWNAEQLVQVKTIPLGLPPHGSGWQSADFVGPHAAIAPHGRWLSVRSNGTGLTDARFHLFDGHSGKEILGFSKEFVASGPIEFSPDGRFLAAVVGSEQSPWWTKVPYLADLVNKVPWVGAKLSPKPSLQSLVNVWELPSCRLRTSLQQENDVMTLRFSPDGSMLATGGSDGEITLWEVPGAR